MTEARAIPVPVPHPIHTRRIEATGRRLGDGEYLARVELVDIKGFDIDAGVMERRPVPAGTPYHTMVLDLRFDGDLMILGIEATIRHAPYSSCIGAAEILQKIVGRRIGGGWTADVIGSAGRAHGCTHLAQLLPIAATVAYQTLTEERLQAGPQYDSTGRPMRLDSCFSYTAQGDAGRRLLQLAPSPTIKA